MHKMKMGEASEMTLSMPPVSFVLYCNLSKADWPFPPSILHYILVA